MGASVKSSVAGVFRKNLFGNRRCKIHKAAVFNLKNILKPCVLVRSDIAGVELRDGDGNNRNTEINVLQNGMARFYWQRYEIESYLVHPDSIAAFVQELSGQQEAADLALSYLQNNLPPAVFANPLGKHGQT